MNLRRVRNGWAEDAPSRCPNGHRLGPNLVLVSWQPCGNCGGHRTHFCRTCAETIYTPPITPCCRWVDFDAR